MYFGCVGIFTYLFRGEVVERTLHYYFLSPVRREVLMAGKYFAGLITAVFFFCGSIALCLRGHVRALSQVHEIRAYVFDGPAFAFAGVRRHHVPGVHGVWRAVPLAGDSLQEPDHSGGDAAVLGIGQHLSALVAQEDQHPVLPSKSHSGAMQASMDPARYVGGVADPASVPVALIGLFVITAGLLALAAKDLRRSEISYSTD